MKKFKLFILALALLSCFVLASCAGKAGDPSKGLSYSLNEAGDAYTVTSIGKCKDTEIVIPAEYEGIPVTAIGARAFRGSNITKITITENIVSIADDAFENCADLVYNTYETLSYIGTAKNPYYALVLATENSKETFKIHSSTVIIADYAFYNCSIKELSLPESITHIGGGAFYSCGAIESISVPEGVTHVGSEAFGNCGSLAEVSLPNSLEYLGDSAFMYCLKLKTIAFSGTEAEWGKVSADGWDKYFNSCSISFTKN